MIFIKFTKTDNFFYKNVYYPLYPCMRRQLPTLLAMRPTFSTDLSHKAPKWVNPLQYYVCRMRLTPVFQRTRTNPTNYIASRIARILPNRAILSPPPLLSLLRTSAYCVLSGGAA